MGWRCAFTLMGSVSFRASVAARFGDELFLAGLARNGGRGRSKFASIVVGWRAQAGREARRSSIRCRRSAIGEVARRRSRLVRGDLRQMLSNRHAKVWSFKKRCNVRGVCLASSASAPAFSQTPVQSFGGVCLAERHNVHLRNLMFGQGACPAPVAMVSN